MILSPLFSIIFLQLGSCHDLIFPEGFKFGAATAAYQVEGGWNVSDKAENIWDRYTHTRSERIADGSTGDVACDSYHQWKKDVEVAKELGLHFYRFSINWPRLLPNGVSNNISEAGCSYYNNLINELLNNDIEPIITLYHWELPQNLQNLGGWTNPIIVDWFEDYARTVYSLFGDRVKTWITINEPIAVCDFVYNTGQLAPALTFYYDFSNYICTKNVLMAHAKAWRVYDEEFKSKYRGRVSITNQLYWMQPAPGEEEETAEIARQYYSDRFTHPIYSKEGGWPKALEQKIAENSKKEGLPRSRLPALSQEEIEYIRGTHDFFGFNFYTSRQARKPKSGEVISKSGLEGIPEVNVVLEGNPDWKAATEGSWLLLNPQGFRRQLNWIKDRYGDLEIMILENGCPTSDDLEDPERVTYYQEHLEQVLLAIEEDKLNITHYTAWTMIDNFEWMDGYRTKFGLYHVDFTNPSRPRTPRASAKFYSQIIQGNKKNTHTSTIIIILLISTYIIILLIVLFMVKYCSKKSTVVNESENLAPILRSGN